MSLRVLRSVYNPEEERFIDNQETHHQKFTYEYEFITMLKKQGIPYDPEHVFD